MSPPDFLKERFPRLGGQLPRSDFATLPTPVRQHQVLFQELPGRISIKYDNLTGSIYGGNKIRKLEYIFPRAAKKHCLRVATFGAAGSNHALATALYAREAGFDCTCFLSHQAKRPWSRQHSTCTSAMAQNWFVTAAPMAPASGRCANIYGVGMPG